jgi:hypothetical protein
MTHDELIANRILSHQQTSVESIFIHRGREARARPVPPRSSRPVPDAMEGDYERTDKGAAAHVEHTMNAGDVSAAQAATNKEHNMSVMDAFRRYPKAVMFSLIFSTCVHMPAPWLARGLNIHPSLGRSSWRVMTWSSSGRSTHSPSSASAYVVQTSC